MKKIQNFYKNISAIIIVTILAIEGLIVKQLKETKIENEWIILLCSIIILVFIFKILGWVVEKAIEGSEFIRALILGEDFIEGIWFDMVTIDGIKYYGLVTHSYKGGKVEQSGEQISSSGLTLNMWNTVTSQYEDNTLIIVYRVNYLDERNVEQRLGLSTIDFSKQANHKRPSTFSGTFYDKSYNFITKSFRGFKITDKNILSQLKNPETKLTAIQALINSNYFKEIL